MRLDRLHLLKNSEENMSENENQSESKSAQSPQSESSSQSESARRPVEVGRLNFGNDSEQAEQSQVEQNPKAEQSQVEPAPQADKKQEKQSETMAERLAEAELDEKPKRPSKVKVGYGKGRESAFRKASEKRKRQPINAALLAKAKEAASTSQPSQRSEPIETSEAVSSQSPKPATLSPESTTPALEPVTTEPTTLEPTTLRANIARACNARANNAPDIRESGNRRVQQRRGKRFH